MSSRRVTVVTSEPLGRPGTGGAGTADSLLAAALGRHGHHVELLVASGRDIGELSPEWTQRYADAGVSVRLLERIDGVRPRALAPTFEVLQALRAHPPDVAIVNDWRGLGYGALRARQVGRGFDRTAFVAHCHGPGRVLAEFAQKVPDTVERFLEEITERFTVELADTVVSPSAWLLDWMRAHDWPVPESAQVIQYVRQAVAFDEEPPRAPPHPRIQRLAFFGQLREGKGIRLFVDALSEVADDLPGIELLFLGAASARWTEERIEAALGPHVRERLADLRFQTRLDRETALSELRRPGTLAVMPSLLDNSPNTVSECIEHGIPFVAAATGGIPELVAAEDRGRVLFAPTVADLAAALRRALRGTQRFEAARPARNPEHALDSWLDLVEHVAPAGQPHRAPPARIAVVCSDEAVQHAQRLAASTRTLGVDVVVDASRSRGAARTDADWVVFLDEQDLPDPGLLDELAAAQAASGADVVTAAVRGPDDQPGAVQLFLGDPDVLGLAGNHYGVLALLRRSLLPTELPEGGPDRDWPLLAELALAGAHIVSIPDPLSRHSGAPGSVSDVPGAGLTVLELFEAHAGKLPQLPQLAATLAAAYARLTRTEREPAAANGLTGLARRVKGRLAGR